jgi:glutathione S-transferase
MKVYGHPMSTCTRKVLTTLAEKGHEAQFVLVDLMKGEQKSPAHVARQPFGVVPVLEDEGFSLYESRAIIRYLDAKLPGTSLTPSTLQARGRMEQWMSVEQSYFTPHVMAIVTEMLMKAMRGGGKPDMEKVSKAREQVAKTLDILDRTLLTQAHLAGDSFSLADITWMPYVEYLFPSQSGDLITSRPHVSAWWQRVSTRPSWKKVTG